MKLAVKSILMTAALAALILPVAAQTAAPTDPQAPSKVGARTENQQDRISPGIKSGQLTAGEAANLEHKQAQLHREVTNARAANGGKLTQAERQRVNKQQNQMSKQIYRDKHNAQRAR